MTCNIYLFFSNGEIFSYSIAEAFHCIYSDSSLQSEELPKRYLDIFHESNQSTFNLYEEHPFCTCEGVESCIYQDRYYSMVPVFSNLVKRVGLLLIRYGYPFAEDEKILCEYTAAIISMELLRREQERIRRESLEIARAKLAVSSLTFSERMAGAAVLQMLDSDEGTVFLNMVANQIYATKSIVSGALKKLESAGVIRTKSQGVKGKYIRITNDYLRSEFQNAELLQEDPAPQQTSNDRGRSV